MKSENKMRILFCVNQINKSNEAQHKNFDCSFDLNKVLNHYFYFLYQQLSSLWGTSLFPFYTVYLTVLNWRNYLSVKKRW